METKYALVLTGSTSAACRGERRLRDDFGAAVNNAAGP